MLDFITYVSVSSTIHFGLDNRVNMEFNLQSSFGLHLPQLYSRAKDSQPLPAFGLLYEGAIGQPR